MGSVQLLEWKEATLEKTAHAWIYAERQNGDIRYRMMLPSECLVQLRDWYRMAGTILIADHNFGGGLTCLRHMRRCEDKRRLLSFNEEDSGANFDGASCDRRP
jgi:hypothetical protein